jgi:site-specific DNA recombinase
MGQTKDFLMTVAAIYARVSSDRQKEEHTIGSQILALTEYAQNEGITIPDQWIFKDEAYSGATLVRPGLERLRDLACEGQLEKILILSPDRLSRKYAYQVLLVEEFSRNGIEVVFIKSIQAKTPEEHLLLQFQGMIAEYERAQIVERTRRGKRFRAKSGLINVLSGAPYGYQYVKKTETSSAYYKVIEEEAKIVRTVYKLYVEDGLSINAIARWLNNHKTPTRKKVSLWERSTIWAMLRNPAYKGTACFGKTRITERKRITRPLRQRGGYTPRSGAHIELPKDQWIEIPVPPIIEEDIFYLSKEKLENNKKHSPRRTIEPTLLQSMLVCKSCGYAYYRTSTKTSKRKLYYYRCLGSDNYRYANGRVCQNKPIRQDYLDEFIWNQIVELLSNPELVRSEIHRRIEEIKNVNPTKQRKESIEKEIVRIEKSIRKLLDAYQEDLLQLDELRERMPQLRRRQSTLRAELRDIDSALTDQHAVLRLTNNIETFLHKLRKAADTISVVERQKVLRLIVNEIQLDDESITIKHSIPLTTSSITWKPIKGPEVKSYLLRSGCHHRPLGGTFLSADKCALRYLRRSF